ncbi:MAG: hypothetical protein IJW82_05640, partial [Clostridia bacterium]|nr:hypothetical protein [Clostridia bacterium]
RAWYVFRVFNNSLLTMILVSLTCNLYLWIFYLLAKIPFLKNHFYWTFWVYLLASIIAYVLVVCYTKTTYVSTFGYYMIIQIAFMFALCSECKTIFDLIRNITLSTYSVFVVIVIILLLLLSEDSDFDLSGFEFDFDPCTKQEIILDTVEMVVNKTTQSDYENNSDNVNINVNYQNENETNNLNTNQNL